MRRTKKTVQGTYIPVTSKEAIERQARREGIKPSTLASEILNREALKLIKKEKKGALSIC